MMDIDYIVKLLLISGSIAHYIIVFYTHVILTDLKTIFRFSLLVPPAPNYLYIFSWI